MRWSLGAMLLFCVLAFIGVVQNAGVSATFSFLGMRSLSFFKLGGLLMICSILWGVFLVLFIQNLFSGIKRPELTKFDLDKPL